MGVHLSKQKTGFPKPVKKQSTKAPMVPAKAKMQGKQDAMGQSMKPKKPMGKALSPFYGC